MEKWYRINKDVEYSTLFDFFLKNQIMVSKSGIKHSFNSRLEAKCFKKVDSFHSKGELDNETIIHECRLIHNEILNGKHGIGEIVN